MASNSWWARGGLVAAIAVVALVGPAVPASAVSIVEHTNPTDDPGACFFEPNDVPGVTVRFEATCIFVHEPTGDLRVVARAPLPAGFAAHRPYRGTLNCSFNGVASSGTIVATPSGQVVATCVVPGGA